MARDTLFRSLHDIGLAAWFGGTLANAVALNAAAGAPRKGRDRGAVANTGWDRWTPVNAVAIGAHLIGGAGVLTTSKHRLTAQHGAATMTITKLALTGAALGATGYARLLGRRVAAQTDVAVSDGTTAAKSTPPEVAAAQRQLAVFQWAIPALTGAMLVVNPYAEQQRANEAATDLAARIISH
ncbi:MAG TPA: hypothetical protein VK816_02855 [Jatrophihabitantaceae bacterium]|jgi:hypothetical protein|nr:hypothetical protein [Jatrophihabitantaceae bacterium]